MAMIMIGFDHHHHRHRHRHHHHHDHHHHHHHHHPHQMMTKMLQQRVGVYACVCVQHLTKCKTCTFGFLRVPLISMTLNYMMCAGVAWPTELFYSNQITAKGQSHACSWLPNEEGCIHDGYDSGILAGVTYLHLFYLIFPQIAKLLEFLLQV